MKKLFKSKYCDAIILTAASCLNILFAIIIYSINLLPEWGGKSIWNTGDLESATTIFNYFSALFIAVFCINVALLALSVLLIFIKNKKLPFFILLPFNIVVNLALMLLNFGMQFFRTGVFVCVFICIISSTAQLIYLIIKHIRSKEIKEETLPEPDSKKLLIYKVILLVCQILTTVLVISAFFIPLYTVGYATKEPESFRLIQALSISLFTRPFPLTLYISFLIFFIAFFASLIYFVSSIQFFLKSDRIFVKKSKKYLYCNIAFLVAYFILGYCQCFIKNLNGESAVTFGYIPLICALVIFVVFFAVQGKMGYGLEDENIKNVKKLKIESLIYVILLTCITFTSLLLNMIEIHMESGNYKNDVSLSGYELLTTYGDLGGGLQTLAFVLFAVLLTSGALFIFTLVSYFTKYKDYGKVTKTAAIINTVFVVLIGLSGIYFKIAQAINVENIESIIKHYGINLPKEFTYTYTIQSKSIYMLIASFIVLLVMLIRGQLSSEKPQAASPSADYSSSLPNNVNAVTSEPAAKEYDSFDACPAFTELDSKIEIFNNELAKRRENLFENPSLPNLVRFVVDYARECRLHLSYSLEDIATFVAGLGASRLTILQGMSGTGKTSLPKIFSEAIMGNCEIVEVESSWRDKNELLGYYNEFSKCFTPKKFTQCLYKAKLNFTVPTFIVLDEMNLSRIEYYFSDFLSLMEHEEDKREIKLLNVKLYRTENGEKKSYSALTDGHTIKIPSNVWFIGTANRDESTFEISDKVYDRAQTMNFNKRAPKIRSFGNPLPQKFVPYDKITGLFENAKSSFSFDAESNAIIQKVEKILTPYNISFGNRILRQMEDFVKIYCSCFADRDAVINEAVEKILLSKVVCKLEYKIVANKDSLAMEFDKLGLAACGAFIRRLNED